jgi:hypothetical protein
MGAQSARKDPESILIGKAYEGMLWSTWVTVSHQREHMTQSTVGLESYCKGR